MCEQKVANEDPAEAFRPISQLQNIIRGAGLSGEESGSSKDRGGTGDAGRKGGRLPRQVVADISPE